MKKARENPIKASKKRKSLLSEFGNKCAISGSAKNLESHHIVPKSKGGSDSYYNRIPITRELNLEYGNRDHSEIFSNNPKMLKFIEDRVNSAPSYFKPEFSIMHRILKLLIDFFSSQSGIKLFTQLGKKTQLIRQKRGISKDHWIDACSLGSQKTIIPSNLLPYKFQATGRGNRLCIARNKFGLARQKNNGENYAKKVKTVDNFRSGDVVKIISGKNVNVFGFVTVSKLKKFKITPLDGGKILHCGPSRIKLIQRNIGFRWFVDKNSTNIKGE
jgi:hypothetical protein